MRRHVLATFDTERLARAAIDDLMAAGFARQNTSLMLTGAAREQLVEADKAPEGAASGGLLGAIAGGLIAVASLAVPGGIFVAGPFWAALGGAATGAAGGGLLGALIGAGLPEDNARTFERGLRRGRILVGVDAEDTGRSRIAERILRNAGANEHPVTVARSPRETTLV